MGRRGVTIIITLLGAAVVVSLTAFLLLYLLVGRQPSVPSDATLVLEVGGDLAELVPETSWGYLTAARNPTVHSIAQNLRKAKSDARITSVLLKPTGFTTPYWGKVHEIRDAVIDFKESGKPIHAYLEDGGDRDVLSRKLGRQSVPDAIEPAGLDRRRQLRALLSRDARKDWRRGRFASCREYKSATNTFTERGFTGTRLELPLAGASGPRQTINYLCRNPARDRPCRRKKHSRRAVMSSPICLLNNDLHGFAPRTCGPETAARASDPS